MARRLLQASLAASAALTLLGTTVFDNRNKERTDDVFQTKLGCKKISLEEAIQHADKLCERVKNESGTPGLVISVSVDSHPVYQKGFGYADIENHILCDSNTVLRIASISKSMTMAVVAKLWQEGKLCLDKDIREYVPNFPEKYFEGVKVEITLRQLISHLSGIRHYDKVPSVDAKTIANNSEESRRNLSSEKGNHKDEFDNQEYLLNSHFDTVSKSLALFQDDELYSQPGTKFRYTTHGWTLVSAVVESIVEKPFPLYMKTFFHDMGLKNTYLDENKPLVYNRGRYYIRNEKGRLENAPQVDNSYKWAGGGFLSTSDDLVRFGNAMLYSYQNSDGYLNRNIAVTMWTPVANTSLAWDKDGKYGMGWGVIPAQSNYPFCKSRNFYVTHTGGAIGASSVLLILPRLENESSLNCDKPVRGIVVSIIANLQSVGLNQTALEIAQLFDSVAEVQ